MATVTVTGYDAATSIRPRIQQTAHQTSAATIGGLQSADKSDTAVLVSVWIGTGRTHLLTSKMRRWSV